MSSDTQAGPDLPPRSPNEETFQRIALDERFIELRRRYRNFVFPATVAFLAWYLLYVVLSAYARDFMDTEVVGHINVAFVFGVLQFVSTFGIAWLYARYANNKLDPLADSVRGELE